MAKRRQRTLRILLLGFWGLWVLYLLVFTAYQIKRYNSPADAQPRPPFGASEARYKPPTPAVSATLFAVLGFGIPGAIYLVPKAVRRRKSKTSKP